MRYEIRAMSFAEILDMGFRLLRDHFLVIVGLAATLQVPMAVLQAWTKSTPATSFGATQLAAGILAFLGIILVAPLVGAAVTFALGETYVGRPPTMGGAMRRVLGIVLPLAGTMLLLWLITIGLALLVVGPAFLVYFLVGSRLGALAGVLLGIVAVLLMMYLMLSFMLTTQVMMLEQTFGMGALRRSRTLMRGNLLRGVGIGFLAALIVGVLGGILQFAFSFIPHVGHVVQGVAQAAASAYTAAVLVVLYFDIRCRKEAFDLQHLARLVAEPP